MKNTQQSYELFHFIRFFAKCQQGNLIFFQDFIFPIKNSLQI